MKQIIGRDEVEQILEETNFIWYGTMYLEIWHWLNNEKIASLTIYENTLLPVGKLQNDIH